MGSLRDTTPQDREGQEFHVWMISARKAQLSVDVRVWFGNVCVEKGDEVWLGGTLHQAVQEPEVISKSSLTKLDWALFIMALKLCHQLLLLNSLEPFLFQETEWIIVRIEQETLTPTTDMETLMGMLKALIMLSLRKSEGQDLFFQQYCHHSKFSPWVSNIPACHQVQHRERRHLLLVHPGEPWFGQGPTKGRISAALSH